MQWLIGSFIGLVLSVSVRAEPLIEGWVRLASGESVADAQVRLFDMTDLQRGALARATTDGTGYFALPLASLGRALPERFALGANYPNPFNPSTLIPYQLAASSAVRLEVFNLLGQRIATLVDGVRPAGFHTATWTATDGAGRAVGAGVYIYRMTVGMESQTGRMVLLDGQAGVSAGGLASVMPGASGGRGFDGEDWQVYGLIVSGEGLAPYVDSAFRVEAGMAPVELVVSSGYWGGKATDDACAFCGMLDAFNDDQQEGEEADAEEEAAATDSTSSAGGPDLIVPSASVRDTTLTPGQAFTLHATVHNQGDAQAAATRLRYYRSNNSTITASDTEVGTDAIDALAASDSSAVSIALTAPTGVSPEVGIYYGACVESVSGESHTDNNCSSAVRITVSGQEVPEEEDETPEEEDDAPEEEDDAPEEEDDALVTIPDAKLRAAIAAALGKARGASITVAEMKALIELNAEGMGISDLTGLEFVANLTRLNLWWNNISDVSALGSLTNLTELNLSLNDITDVSALGSLTNLTRLDLSLNDITDVSALGSLTNLTGLNLSLNDITDVSALGSLTNLIWLDLERNDITDVSALGSLTNLIWLDLGVNNITDVSALRGLTHLTWLNLSFNDITDVSALGGLTNLTELNLSLNDITDVSALRGLTHLTKLHLLINPLSFSSINDHIPALERSGVTVSFDSFRESDFDIELVFLDDFTEHQKKVIQYAARRWMSIIIGDLPDYTFTQGWSGQCGDHSYSIPSGERIDDLRIYIVSFDVNLGPRGRGRSDLLRETSLLPVSGCMSFNLAYKHIDTGLVLHEIAHVLGFGTIWGELGFLQNLSYDDPSADTHFNGPQAIAAFNDAGGWNYTGAKVPVEKMDGAHWRRPVLEGELMWIGGGEVLSAITVQSLADLGYVVDVTQTDPYTLPRAAAKPSAKIAAQPTHAQPKLSCGVGQQREPIYVVDPQGRIVRTVGH